MGTTLEDKIAALPVKRRKKIKARAAKLIAEELLLRESRKAHAKTQRSKRAPEGGPPNASSHSGSKSGKS